MFLMLSSRGLERQELLIYRTDTTEAEERLTSISVPSHGSYSLRIIVSSRKVAHTQSAVGFSVSDPVL